MIQEFNVGDNAPATVRAWVDTAFGASFSFYRESGVQIANGIVSRYPILASGFWEDPQSPNREFAYARIDVPGPVDLWAVSVHLLTDDAKRPAEATALVGFINATIQAGDYLVIAGDFNSDLRTEAAVTTLGQVVNVAGPYPVDQAGDPDTNANRNSPYDWVMIDNDLKARQVRRDDRRQQLRERPRVRQPGLHPARRRHARARRRQRRHEHAAHGRRQGRPARPVARDLDCQSRPADPAPAIDLSSGVA